MGKEKELRPKTQNQVIGYCKAKCFRLINLDSAKLVALVMVFGAVFYNGRYKDSNGAASSCSILLTDGQWRGEQEWQPIGCMLHMYTSADTQNCLRHVSFTEKPVHFVYSGDSRIRNHYLAFIHHLDPKENVTIFSTKHINRTYIDTRNRLRVDFFWSAYSHEPCIVNLQKWKNEGHQPTLIIAGSGLWNAVSETKYTLNKYSKSLKRLAKEFNLLLQNETRFVWKLQESIHPKRHQFLENRRLRSYNKAAIKIFNHSAVQIWSSSRLIFLSLMNESRDGLHLGPTALKYDLQIVLNYFCNDYMNFVDGTCCSEKERHITLMQVVTFSMLGLSALIGSTMGLQRLVVRLSTGRSPNAHTHIIDLGKQAPSRDLYTLVTSLARLGLIMAYFYLCDRTNIFHKENKHFSAKSFYLPIGGLLAVGLCLNKASTYGHVLHKDQTDEWKGWMQLVILVYHFTGASQILHIYTFIRILVSSYIFLSGHNHICYFWRTGNAGMLRLLQVLFRLNFMTVLLCMCMDRRYHSYYFVPLISFWYLVVYAVVVIPPRFTEATLKHTRGQYLLMVIKFVVVFYVITLVHSARSVFDAVFLSPLWNYLFTSAADGHADEWWFCWKLDRYSMFYGMVFSSTFLIARSSTFVAKNAKLVSIAASATALVAMGGYFQLASQCASKVECNEVHPYVVFVPILCYVSLRNASRVLRGRYSPLLAWIGRISLELFVGQYHAWLAADSHGLLVVVPRYPVVNVTLTTFVFVCLAHEMHRVTATVLPFAVPNNKKLALRNCLVFVGVLALISRYNFEIHSTG